MSNLAKKLKKEAGISLGMGVAGLAAALTGLGLLSNEDKKSLATNTLSTVGKGFGSALLGAMAIPAGAYGLYAIKKMEDDAAAKSNAVTEMNNARANARLLHIKKLKKDRASLSKSFREIGKTPKHNAPPRLHTNSVAPSIIDIDR